MSSNTKDGAGRAAAAIRARLGGRAVAGPPDDGGRRPIAGAHAR